MNIVITGSREITDYQFISQVLDEWFPRDSHMIIGDAREVDSLALLWAKQNNVSFERYPAEWKKFGRGAGNIRNQVMVDLSDECIAIWDAYSTGTEDCIKRAKAKGMKVEIFLS